MATAPKASTANDGRATDGPVSQNTVETAEPVQVARFVGCVALGTDAAKQAAAEGVTTVLPPKGKTPGVDPVVESDDLPRVYTLRSVMQQSGGQQRNPAAVPLATEAAHETFHQQPNGKSSAAAGNATSPIRDPLRRPADGAAGKLNLAGFHSEQQGAARTHTPDAVIARSRERGGGVPPPASGSGAAQHAGYSRGNGGAAEYDEEGEEELEGAGALLGMSLASNAGLKRRRDASMPRSGNTNQRQDVLEGVAERDGISDPPWGRASKAPRTSSRPASGKVPDDQPADVDQLLGGGNWPDSADARLSYLTNMLAAGQRLPDSLAGLRSQLLGAATGALQPSAAPSGQDPGAAASGAVKDDAAREPSPQLRPQSQASLTASGGGPPSAPVPAAALLATLPPSICQMLDTASANNPALLQSILAKLQEKKGVGDAPRARQATSHSASPKAHVPPPAMQNNRDWPTGAYGKVTESVGGVRSERKPGLSPAAAAAAAAAVLGMEDTVNPAEVLQFLLSYVPSGEEPLPVHAPSHGEDSASWHQLQDHLQLSQELAQHERSGTVAYLTHVMAPPKTSNGAEATTNPQWDMLYTVVTVATPGGRGALTKAFRCPPQSRVYPNVAVACHLGLKDQLHRQQNSMAPPTEANDAPLAVTQDSGNPATSLGGGGRQAARGGAGPPAAAPNASLDRILQSLPSGLRSRLPPSLVESLQANGSNSALADRLTSILNARNPSYNAPPSYRPGSIDLSQEGMTESLGNLARGVQPGPPMPRNLPPRRDAGPLGNQSVQALVQGLREGTISADALLNLQRDARAPTDPITGAAYGGGAYEPGPPNSQLNRLLDAVRGGGGGGPLDPVVPADPYAPTGPPAGPAGGANMALLHQWLQDRVPRGPAGPPAPAGAPSAGGVPPHVLQQLLSALQQQQPR